MQARRDLEVRAPGELGVGERVLDEVADARPGRDIRSIDVDAAHAHGARVGAEHADEQPHERGLARAVQADERVDLAGGDVEVDAVEAGSAAECAREGAGLEAGRAGHARVSITSSARSIASASVTRSSSAQR
ncbi:hypothetical protein GCM10025870_23140 [Agromyces marinus]|uniref:Uncharacterized protein n=1 Tax=Agromyces marinus TaxID=1389020 RepID=A0ABM8H3E2_9MICO|nr:hypothetical protein GCM10025870_23140 [Agromyces marinus]